MRSLTSVYGLVDQYRTHIIIYISENKLVKFIQISPIMHHFDQNHLKQCLIGLICILIFTMKFVFISIKVENN